GFATVPRRPRLARADQRTAGASARSATAAGAASAPGAAEAGGPERAGKSPCPEETRRPGRKALAERSASGRWSSSLRRRDIEDEPQRRNLVARMIVGVGQLG